MRLDRVHVTVASAPLSQAVPMAFSRLDARTLVLVEVEADGVRGIGESWANYPPWAGTERAAALEQGVVPLLAGRDVSDPDRVQRDLWAALGGAARQAGAIGPVWQALSAVDIALWDLMARLRGTSVAALLAGDGPVRERVPGYGSGLGPTDVDECCDRSAVRGYRRVKARVGFGRARDEATLGRIRDRLGEGVELCADANQAWTVAETVEFCAWSGDLGWLEEPVAGNRLDDLRALAAAVEVPLACGENLYDADEFGRFAASGAIGVLQPDLSKNGGFSTARRIADRLPDGVALAPHCYGGAVTTAASVAFAAAHPRAVTVEDDVRRNPFRDDLLAEQLQVADGEFAVPTGPGLGVAVDRDRLEPHVVARKVSELHGVE